MGFILYFSVIVFIVEYKIEFAGNLFGRDFEWLITQVCGF